MLGILFKTIFMYISHFIYISVHNVQGILLRLIKGNRSEKINILKQFWPCKVLILLFLLFGMITPSFAAKPITMGKGIWVNIWNYPLNPEIYCTQLKSKGIDSIYLQISRSNTPAIYNPDGLNKIIKAAHKNNIKVIGWTYPFLKDPISDANKFIIAHKYKTPEGDSLDGLAADIEEVTNTNVIQQFSTMIRKAVGPKYPLIAITFSPALRRADPKHYAWKTIAQNFDIIAPMTYWHSFKNMRSEKGAYDYTAKTILKLKELTGKEDIKIHLIGDAQKTSSKEIIGFLRAADDHGVNAGVSLYPWYKPEKHQIDVLSKFEFKNKS